MGRDLHAACPLARERFALADRVLGYGLSGLCFEGPEDALNGDLNAQLAMYTVCCIISDLLKAQGCTPAVTSGYSAGFYAAAYAAGCFDFETGLGVVRLAGECILEGSGNSGGCMAVVFGLPLETVEGICGNSGGAEVAILNTPRQIVISGTRGCVERALEQAREQGALDTYYLPVSAAYHSSLLGGSSQRFLAALKDIPLRAPQVPLLSYATLESVADPRALARVMADQLAARVLWVDLIRKLAGAGPRRWFEVGPGEVLARTIRWIDRKIRVYNVEHALHLHALAQERAGSRGDAARQECTQA